MTFSPLCAMDVKEICLLSKDFIDGWNEQMLLDGIEKNNLQGLVCRNEDKIIAFITYTVCCDFAEIDDIFVDEKFRKKGVASSLLEKTIESVKDKTQKIFLEVRENNIPAINLYTKYGFTKVSVRKNYYSDGENAIVLVKEN